MRRTPKLGRWDVAGAALLLLFAGSLFAWTQRGGGEAPAGGDLLDPSAEVRLGHEWMGLYFRGQKVGLMHLEKQRRDGGGFRFALETRLKLLQLRGDARIDLEVDAELSEAMALERFEFRLDAGPAKLAGRGEVVEGGIDVSLRTGGSEQKRRIALERTPVLRSTLGPTLSREQLKPGARYTVHVFDPLTQRDQPVDVEVIGPDTVLVMDQEVPATRIRQTVSGLTLEGWMNARGEMLRQELGLGLVAVRETEEQARWGLAGAAAVEPTEDVFGASLIPVKGLPPIIHPRRPKMYLALSGVDLEGYDLESPRQRVAAEGERTRVTIELESVPRGLPLPVRGAPPETLAATPLVQADHPEIEAAARAAVGDAGDTVSATLRLATWVRANVRQELVPGVPSALETLKTRVGDCNEHSTLFAALARSVGVPTRIVVGLVYREGHFGYHAWNEVLTVGGWLSVDAMWDQVPADVGHLRFVVGGLERQIELLRMIGRLRVEVLADSGGAR